MISLVFYRQAIEAIAAEVPGLNSVLPVTVDKEMAKVIQAIPKECVTLFLLPPSAQSETDNPDAWVEDNECVLFVMERYDPSRRSSFDVLETSQVVAQAFVDRLLAQTRSCPRISVELPSINMQPETQFYAGFAGWSIGFKIISH